MSSTIHRKYRYFHSTVQTTEDRRQKFHKFLPFPVWRNVMLNLSINKTDVLSSTIKFKVPLWFNCTVVHIIWIEVLSLMWQIANLWLILIVHRRDQKRKMHYPLLLFLRQPFTVIFV